MGKIYARIDDHLQTFIEGQHVFFVATAPSATNGHVNCSPKGLDTLRILDARTVVYLEFVGSGVETIAHLRENGRVVLMFCAFEGPPKIVRLHGRGAVVTPADADFAALFQRFGRRSTLGVRSVIRIALDRISDSCGYGVPLYRFEGDREQLAAWAERKGAAGIETYKRENNATSIDGLKGLEP